MELRWETRLVGLAMACLLLGLSGAHTEVVAAQGLDPASTVGAYAAALNSHDVGAGLALFDSYGSATDEQGHHFEGRAALTSFLLDSGFGNPDAHVTTDHLRVLGNRAVWTYSCSCSDGPIEVRLVLNQDKISVFFMSRSPAASTTAAAIAARQDTATRQFAIEVGIGLALGLTVVGLAVRYGRRPAQTLPTRPTQGSLLATLAQSRGLSYGAHAAESVTTASTAPSSRGVPGQPAGRCAVSPAPRRLHRLRRR